MFLWAELIRSKREARTRVLKPLQDESCCSAYEQQWWKIPLGEANFRNLPKNIPDVLEALAQQAPKFAKLIRNELDKSAASVIEAKYTQRVIHILVSKLWIRIEDCG